MGTTKRIGFPLVGVILAALAIAVGGGCSADVSDTYCDGGRCRSRDGAVVDAGRTPQATDLVALELDPADPVLDAVDGARPTTTFRAVARQRDGRTRALASGLRFTIDDPQLGELSEGDGTFRAAGIGGATRVRVATLDGSRLAAETTVTVRVRRTVLGAGLTPADRARVDSAMPAPDAAMTGPRVDYPLERAVMPRNVNPPQLMWTPRHPSAAGADVYRVMLERPNATLAVYLRADAMGFAHAFRAETAVWREIAESDINEPIRMTVSVLSGAVRYDGAARAFRTVDAVVAGSVYYWSPPQGRLMRLDVDGARRVDFLPNPPGGCIACHAISRDGRTLTAVTDDGRPLSSYDLTRDLTSAPPPSRFRSGEQTMRVSSFNGDGTRIVTSPHGGGDLHVIDATSGASVAATGMLPSGLDPEWSPDSSGIAYTAGNNIMLLPAMSGDRFGAPVMLHAGASSPDGEVDWHPTWTPDSRWLVYQHGAGAFTTGAGALWIVSRAGGTAVRLDNLNGGPMQADSFRPVASPFNSGGYFWVLFTSTRPYGNTTAGVHGHKQIWVAAIRNHPDGRTDPSEVSYYLDGQEPVTNLSPHWAPPPCRSNGVTCATGADCCSGECAPDESGNPICRTPRGSCRTRGASCDTSGDCCEGLVCTEGRICDYPLPG